MLITGGPPFETLILLRRDLSLHGDLLSTIDIVSLWILLFSMLKNADANMIGASARGSDRYRFGKYSRTNEQ